MKNVKPPHPLMMKARRLCAELEDQGGDALIAGGAVRDTLMGREVSDVDIAHNMGVDAIKKIFPSIVVGQGESFGVVVAKFEDEHFELACFRQESGYSDGKHPDRVTMALGFAQDASRRDFTVNAMGMRANGCIVDPCGGMQDLLARVIRCVGCPLDRFAEDPVRMLRAARFAATLRFSLDEDLVSAGKSFAIRLDDVAPERITKEILKSSGSGSSLASFIENSDRMGLLERFLPEVAALKGLPHAELHHPEGGVYAHTLAALRCSTSDVPEHNLALLLHDIGKAVTGGESPTGLPTYHGHEAAGREMIPAIAARMHWPAALSRTCQAVCSEHMKGHLLEEMNKSTRIAFRMQAEWPAIRTCVMADSRCRLYLHREDRMMEQLDKLEKDTESWKDKADLDKKLNGLANGRLIMEALPGIQGKDIGKVKAETWNWLMGRSLASEPEEVKAYLTANYGKEKS